ncbi:zinc finger protein 397-like isoform X1 [Helicoverpa zea]|uniref:zinc finger protein 397-like isoform X1 n=1 Tax=Helicoverpa zea TaxID=7113 RepID=UPI001F55F799|nr:zinc finger protein 397-like isoform X1 [Helicoverpa zea]XP_047039369.1 zinc finger protein 397-like isoform X1 [Helicoverpa zea]XP_047039370.1 zinc finger protein 397-like isoform X1 [Helicoverpa zea]
MEVYRLCCCCQELVCLKSLWSEYRWMGSTEVYGDMLQDCFNLTWPRMDHASEQICEVCITQLRNALQFKQKVLHSQNRLKAQLLDIIPPLKEERTEIAINDEDIDRVADDIDFNADSEICGTDTIISVKEEVTDILKDGTGEDPPDKTKVRRKITRSKTTNCRKAVKKRRKEINKKTLNYINPRQNLGLILEHSSILPFKSNKGYFNCFYCNKQYASFEQLKLHVIELHNNLSFKLILKSIRRPRDRIRADVSDINCRLCKKNMKNLDILIEHLTVEHNVKFNFDSDAIKPRDCIVAYDLSEGKYRCYECKAEFFFFKTLTNHMNEHSTDHVCDVCGRCFLLADRLRAHSQSHKASKTVKCDLCGKICGSNMLLKSHIRYKHKKLSYMCSICDKSFQTSQKRMQHFEEVHNRTPLNLTCKVCSKKFELHKSLYAHMRADHLNLNKERKYGCDVCGTMFKSRNCLSLHMVVHSGEKNYECEICHKKYGRRKTLTEHLRIHMNDRRFACRACSQAFVQKCSLKNHIRVHHSDMDYEQLIVDKKLDVK